MPQAPDRDAQDRPRVFPRDPFPASNAAEYAGVEFSLAEFHRRCDALNRLSS